jgi:hypothetical protein
MGMVAQSVHGSSPRATGAVPARMPDASTRGAATLADEDEPTDAQPAAPARARIASEIGEKRPIASPTTY